MSDMPRPRWPHLLREVSRHGTVSWVVRVGHGPRTRLRALYGSSGFEAEYHAAIRGEATQARPKRQDGTLAWLVAKYQASWAWVPGTAHGLRKAAATRLANAGVSEAQLDAVMGWTPGSGMARVYIRGRDTALLAAAAIKMLKEAKERTLYSQPKGKVGNEGENMK